VRTREFTAYSGLEEETAGPLAGARAPLRVSAPPSSGSAVVPNTRGVGLLVAGPTPLHATVRAVRAQGGTGGGGDGKVGLWSPPRRPLQL
jgi:hypothetical protein